ncbi:hypothetical protein L7F22_056302 [Adiantum nelumboides]|nr:hypothetical protein [Adiantum nelumboides]
MEHKGLHHGDIVHLLSENKIVALGRVHTTEPSDLCHGELLGNGFCSISIDKCLDIQAYLPFPTIDASMVNEVVGGFVKWDIQNVKTVKEVEMNGHTYAATSPNDFIFEANGAPNTEDGISLRESWRERKVMLWSKENTEVLGYGVILLALPYEVINFDLLGEEDVGVVVDKSYNESAGTCTTDDLDCINLVRWPIKRLTFEDRTPLIQEESTKTPTLEDATMVDECEEFIAGHKSIFVRKRTYLSGRDDEATKLRAFPLVIREGAKAWYQTLAPEERRDWETLKMAFIEEFRHQEPPEEIWRQLLELRQTSPNDYRSYEGKFSNLWEKWCALLGEGERAPECLKKDCFLARLYPILREKVKVKFSDTFENAMAYAREKDRKLKFQAQLQGGMEPPPPAQPIARAVAGTSATDQESSQQELLQQITNQLESLSINLVQGVRAPQTGNDRNRQEGQRQTREYVCYNCGEVGHGMYFCPHPRHYQGNGNHRRAPQQQVTPPRARPSNGQQNAMVAPPIQILRPPPPPPQAPAEIPPLPSDVELWMLLMGMEIDKDKLRTVPLVMQGKAKAWFEGLEVLDWQSWKLPKIRDKVEYGDAKSYVDVVVLAKIKSKKVKRKLEIWYLIVEVYVGGPDKEQPVWTQAGNGRGIIVDKEVQQPQDPDSDHQEESDNPTANPRTRSTHLTNFSRNCLPTVPGAQERILNDFPENQESRNLEFQKRKTTRRCIPDNQKKKGEEGVLGYKKEAMQRSIPGDQEKVEEEKNSEFQKRTDIQERKREKGTLAFQEQGAKQGNISGYQENVEEAVNPGTQEKRTPRFLPSIQEKKGGEGIFGIQEKRAMRKSISGNQTLDANIRKLTVREKFSPFIIPFIIAC